ncbi:hypothetical protein EW146_g2196 [Bondarzewia mesenterica]|uniref:RNA helicase n=1 Tax=Bondarzewia mesenterica TaxID=1095465 RepID=A0A4S4M1C1_9AGAM|nr:hypothetical protein EW146_g2196 [Bondarzewia mesenterica]
MPGREVPCELCRRLFTDAHAYKFHVQGKDHKKRAKGAGKVLWCRLCDRVIMGMHFWEMHMKGKPHASVARRLGVTPTDVQPEEAPAFPGGVCCDLCDFFVKEKSWTAHANTARHKSGERFAAYKIALNEASEDKQGVVVSHGELGVNFGVLEVSEAGRGVRVELVVHTTAPTSSIKISRFTLSSSLNSSAPVSSFRVQVLDPAHLSLEYGREARISVTFQQTSFGRYKDSLEIIFQDTVLGKQFAIVRSLQAIVGNKSDHQLLKPSAPYVPRVRTERDAEISVVAGVLPPALTSNVWVNKLPKSQIPSSLSSILSRADGPLSGVIKELKQSVLPRIVNANTYAQHFKALLWIEEYRMEYAFHLRSARHPLTLSVASRHDLQIFDISDAQLTRRNKLYFLEVPGLAEKRPSVLIGDRILVQRHGIKGGKWFEGHVHVVERREVGLCFHTSFPTPTQGQMHNVHFKLNRVPLLRQHQALNAMFKSKSILFPSQQHVTVAKRGVVTITLFNRQLADNPQQMEAVRSIAHRRAPSVPFVVFGPPGTGKTVTIVEAIRQIINKDENTRILACAPSNSAADIIASRLTDLGKNKIFRLYASSRPMASVPAELKEFTFVNPDGHFALHPKEKMLTFRVIVSTCVSASFAHGIGIPRGHFSHIFVDEAGQATEPEVMVAIRTMTGNKTSVVLSGDPKQLGPVIRSTIARQSQLDMSYLERIMKGDAYDIKENSGITIVKLTKNYRSHGAILKFPNEQFYDGELKPCGDRTVTDSLIGSPQLASRNFPIIFHSVSGKDDREASSPSFFNIDEVSQVKAYIQSLRSNDGRFQVAERDIGVITPYHAQCVKIRRALAPLAGSVKVGSVEEFQGQERRVIIISTVRSSRNFVEYDLKHTLGFVANPRRFNVAVTRAQALLIIVGDATVLSLDPLWRRFLNYIHDNMGWLGDPITWDPSVPVRDSGGYDAELRERGVTDMNDFERRMQSLAPEGVGESDDVEESDINIDRRWRDVE